MSTPAIDWTTFKMHIFIESPAEEVYKAWTTKARIQQWFLELADYSGNGQPRRPDEPFVLGDDFSWKWHNWDFREEGKILKANGIDHFSFTFGKGGIVHVHLNSKNGGTEVSLIQEQIPTDEKSKKEIFVGCSTGWTFWLTNLKAWLEHGITLHATGLSQEQTANRVNS